MLEENIFQNHYAQNSGDEDKVNIGILFIFVQKICKLLGCLLIYVQYMSFS
jgi:hypothetical protein